MTVTETEPKKAEAVPDGTPDQVTKDAAKEHAERIRGYIGSIAQHVEVWSAALIQAYREDHWKALDYESWEAYCHGEFNDSLSHLRSVYVVGQAKEMHAAGMSLRAIETATGISKSNLQRALNEIYVGKGIRQGKDELSIEPPARVKGTDGKRQPAKKTAGKPKAEGKKTAGKPKAEGKQEWRFDATGTYSGEKLEVSIGNAGLNGVTVLDIYSNGRRRVSASMNSGEWSEFIRAEYARLGKDGAGNAGTSAMQEDTRSVAA